MTKARWALGGDGFISLNQMADAFVTLGEGDAWRLEALNCWRLLDWIARSGTELEDRLCFALNHFMSHSSRTASITSIRK